SLTLYETENGDIYFFVLDEGSSCIYIFDENFNKVKVIDEFSRDGIVKIIIKDNKLYGLGFHSGKIVVYDLQGTIDTWAPERIVSLKSRIFNGAFLNDTLALISIDKEIIFVDKNELFVLKRERIPVKALSIESDGHFFYVTIFYNYSQVEDLYKTEKGLYIYDEEGSLENKIDTGKRPSYIFVNDRIIGVINYLDNNFQLFRRIGSYIFEMNEVEIGKFSNFPVVRDDELLICSLIENRIYKYNFIKEESGIIETNGKGPIKCETDSVYYYIISVFSGTFEVLSKDGNLNEIFYLQGYPVDFIVFNEYVLILLQESWYFSEVLGELVVISF
ncbi:MAG: hypothetical protein ACOC80_08330, partial [Petrotogales bacterium]